MNVLPIHIQGCVEVGGGISSHNHGYKASILLRIGVEDVAQLHVELEGSMTFITPKFQPQLIRRDNIMPCETSL